MTVNTGYERDPIDHLHRRINDANIRIDANTKRMKVTTIPVYDSSNWPDDAVRGQLARDIRDPNTLWVYGEDDEWHEIGVDPRIHFIKFRKSVDLDPLPYGRVVDWPSGGTIITTSDDLTRRQYITELSKNQPYIGPYFAFDFTGASFGTNPKYWVYIRHGGCYFIKADWVQTWGGVGYSDMDEPPTTHGAPLLPWFSFCDVAGPPGGDLGSKELTRHELATFPQDDHSSPTSYLNASAQTYVTKYEGYHFVGSEGDGSPLLAPPGYPIMMALFSNHLAAGGVSIVSGYSSAVSYFALTIIRIGGFYILPADLTAVAAGTPIGVTPSAPPTPGPAPEKTPMEFPVHVTGYTDAQVKAAADAYAMAHGGFDYYWPHMLMQEGTITDGTVQVKYLTYYPDGAFKGTSTEATPL